jgi:pyruvate dehydrogenase E2 component (dihydrolipoamide acetyltransferase)
MPKSFKLPDLGEGIHEGEVLSVLVAVGDTVTEGDAILEVETDKAAAEVPSPFTGEVAEIKVKPGDIVQVGDVLMTFSGVEGGEEPPPEEKEPPLKEEKEEPERLKKKRKRSPSKGRKRRRFQRPRPRGAWPGNWMWICAP